MGELIRKNGNEFGSTTGRPRRCGWIDLVALNFACMINGVTQLVMTKADVLDNIDILKVCNKYNINGKETMQVPFQMEGKKLDPIYEEFAGWKTDISGIKDFKIFHHKWILILIILILHWVFRLNIFQTDQEPIKLSWHHDCRIILS